MKKTEIVEYKLSFEEIIEKFNIKGKYINWNGFYQHKEDEGIFKRILSWFGKVNGISIKVKK